MTKYINADELINIYGSYPTGKTIQIGELIDVINNLSAEEVIPISFIREWLADHPDPISAAIRDAWATNS